MNITEAIWWPIALSTEIVGTKPKGLFVAGEPIVLFRDADGQIRALEDRCPHRRVPLSLGTVRPEGWLQCGYHGWSFDGTGKCVDIPSLRAGEKVPAAYATFSYRAAEQDGLVYVTSSLASAPPSPGDALVEGCASGRRMIGLSHDAYVTALLDGPRLLLRCAGFRISDTMISDPTIADGHLVTERAGFWFGRTSFDAFVREYRLIVRLAVRLGTGEARIALMTPEGETLARMHLAITPSARGTTALLWRSARTASPLAGTMMRLATAIGRAPISPAPDVDMAAIDRLLVGPSEHWPGSASQAGLHGDSLSTRRARA